MNLNQIISSDESILNAAQLTAQSECLSYLRQKYDTSKEFTDTKVWSYATAYTPHDRVYLDADAYSPTSTYALNALTLFGGNVYRCTTAVTVAETFTLSKWSLIGVQYTIYYDLCYRDWETDRKSTRLNSSHSAKSRMPSSA